VNSEAAIPIFAPNIGQINVPLEFLPALKPLALAAKASSFSATVAFGKRLEPWLVALAETARRK